MLRNQKIKGTSKAKKLADIDLTHKHAWAIAIQMGRVLYSEEEIISFSCSSVHCNLLLNFTK